MRVFITNLFYLSCTVFAIIGLLFIVAWLFDSEPKNLFLVFKISARFCMIMSGINFLFGGKEK